MSGKVSDLPIRYKRAVFTQKKLDRINFRSGNGGRVLRNPPGAKTIKKNTNSTQNKSQTHRAKQYEVTSFLTTDCELSTETCSKNVYSIGPRCHALLVTCMVT